MGIQQISIYIGDNYGNNYGYNPDSYNAFYVYNNKYSGWGPTTIYFPDLNADQEEEIIVYEFDSWNTV